MITLRHLQTFVYVAELGSFTKAAEKLFLTQPAVSAQIKTLEEHLGLRLLERNERNVILTEAGQMLLTEGKKILDTYNRLEEKLDALKGIRRGRLILGASTIPGEYILPHFIGQFRHKYPGVDTVLQIGDTGEIHRRLLAREIDLGVTGAPPESDTLLGEPVLSDELIIIAPPDSGREKKEISLQELVGEKFILREEGSGTRRVFFKLLATKGVRAENLRVVMELGSTRAVITAVEAGLGMSIVSRWAVREALALGKIDQLQVEGFPFRRELYMVLLRNKYISHALSAFIDLLREGGATFV